MEKAAGFFASVLMFAIYMMAIYGLGILINVNHYRLATIIFGAHVFYQIFKIGKK